MAGHSNRAAGTRTRERKDLLRSINEFRGLPLLGRLRRLVRSQRVQVDAASHRATK